MDRLMPRLEEDYYLEKCPKCGRYNEFLDETCECGYPLHVYPTIPFYLDDEEE